MAMPRRSTRGARRGDARRDRSAAARGDLGREQSACASAFAPARCAEGFERGRAHAPRAGVARRIEARRCAQGSGSRPTARQGDAATSCKINTILAQTAAKLKLGAADAWGSAITSCAAADPKGEPLVAALYKRRKSSLARRKTRRRSRGFFASRRNFRIIATPTTRAFSARSFIRSRRARRVPEDDDDAPDDYPKGDMRTEALFRAAMQHMLSGDPVAADSSLGGLP